MKPPTRHDLRTLCGDLMMMERIEQAGGASPRFWVVADEKPYGRDWGMPLYRVRSERGSVVVLDGDRLSEIVAIEWPGIVEACDQVRKAVLAAEVMEG